MYWCYNSDHIGVRGEVPRLVAWLIKNCQSSNIFNKLLDIQDLIKCIVEMTTSSHSVMQNEAIAALTILCTECSNIKPENNQKTNKANNSPNKDLQKFCDLLVTADIAKHLIFVIHKCSDKQDIETLNNLVVLLEKLIQSKVIVDHFKTRDLIDSFTKLSINCKTNNMPERIKYISGRFNLH